MTSIKITDLTALSVASSDDLLVMVDDPSGTPVTKKITRANFMGGTNIVQVVGTTETQTLTNKTLTTPIFSSISNTGILTLPTSTDTLVGRATTDTLTNKTLTSPVISTISNSGTLTLPTSTDTLVGRATTDTLTNKTLTTPVIATISNSGTLTLPTSTDTLVGRATTDTLTNKTLTSPVLNTPTVNTPTVTAWSGFMPITDTWTYSSVDGHTFVVSTAADQTTLIQKGDKIKFTNNSTTFYGFVTAITSNSITLYGGTNYAVANSAITAISYSHEKSPFGFINDPSIWKEVASNVGTQQNTPTALTWYNLGSSLAISIGVWTVRYMGSCFGSKNSSTVADVLTTLSTANNSESDVEWSSYFAGRFASGNAISAGSFCKIRQLTLTSKTTYYANATCQTASQDAIAMTDSGPGNQKVIIEAVCAYL